VIQNRGEESIKSSSITLKVWADLACFTRPENKVERVSYDVMTPSAARGVLQSILWKPEMRFLVREIWVLNPIKRFSIVRNEVQAIAVPKTVKKWATDGGGFNAEDSRTQRHSLVLRDVAYLIRADIELLPRATDPIQKYMEMFTRRVSKGQAYRMPYLGTREFSAFFSAADGTETPIAESNELGRMLFDIDFVPQKKGTLKFKQHTSSGSEWVDGVAKPRFFRARLESGILHVPPELYGGI
jgi:CRISPR-associated protein Cas5d